MVGVPCTSDATPILITVHQHDEVTERVGTEPFENATRYLEHAFGRISGMRAQVKRGDMYAGIDPHRDIQSIARGRTVESGIELVLVTLEDAYDQSLGYYWNDSTAVRLGDQLAYARDPSELGRTTPDAVGMGVVHEVGHALGATHEMGTAWEHDEFIEASTMMGTYAERQFDKEVRYRTRFTEDNERRMRQQL